MTKATFELENDWIIVRTSPLPATIPEALEHSINKWEFIEEAVRTQFPDWPYDGAGSTCALCGVAVTCGHCPVGIAGHRGCAGTPFSQYCEARSPEEALRAAKAEIAFLKSLRAKDLNYYMGLPYIIQLRSNNEGWFAKVPALPGCMSQGDTGHEALDNLKEAMELWLEVALEDGDPIPEPKEYA